jgi:hypothetical protein
MVPVVPIPGTDEQQLATKDKKDVENLKKQADKFVKEIKDGCQELKS